jgi:hypothetical protein
MQWLLLIIYFDGNFPNAKLHPYDDYKNVHFKYILWDFIKYFESDFLEKS